MPETFEAVLQARVDEMVDACTRCGKCVEVCPVTGAAGLEAEARDNPVGVITGILDILRHGEGNEAARNWASGCVFSGECIKACDYGVNPRFLVYMARLKWRAPKTTRRRSAATASMGFRNVAHEVKSHFTLQLDDALLERLGQGGKRPAAGELPDFVFYTGCNVLKTPHIALLALDIMDALGATYEVMGGPTHCCGVVPMRTGDVATSGRFGENTIDKLAQSKSKQVVSWCPSCQVQFSDTTLPTLEKTRGAKPFEMTPFTMFCASISTGCGRCCASRCRCGSRCTAIRASTAWSRPRKIFERRAGHRNRRSASARRRSAKQQSKGAAGLPP
jgi:heterodisulfide reductase subunit D